MSGGAFRTIYVTGLPRHMTSWELAEICRPYGEVLSAQVESDPETGMPWHFGFVEFGAAESASRAAAALHGKRFRGDVLAARQIDETHPDKSARARGSRRKSRRAPRPS